MIYKMQLEQWVLICIVLSNKSKDISIQVWEIDLLSLSGRSSWF